MTSRPLRLDPASATAVARFVVGASAIAVWYVFSRAFGAGLTLSAMYGLTALFVAIVAARRREPVERIRLTRWDEAAAFVALSALAGAAGR